MKRITQTLQYEGDNRSELTAVLRDWHSQHPFQTGVDWQFEYLWATMTDEDCLAFCLKHPQFSHRFTTI